MKFFDDESGKGKIFYLIKIIKYAFNENDNKNTDIGLGEKDQNNI